MKQILTKTLLFCLSSCLLVQTFFPSFLGGAEKEEQNINSIEALSMEMQSNIAYVQVSAEDGILVVAVYSSENGKMLGFGMETLEAHVHHQKSSILVSCLRKENTKVQAFLFDKHFLKPLCKPYVLDKQAVGAEPSLLEVQNGVLSRQIAGSGMVLLENRALSSGERSLPIQNDRVALFGAGAVATVKGGRGSGSVNNRKTVSIYDALIARGYTVTSAGKSSEDPDDYILKYYNELMDPDLVYGEYIIKNDDRGEAVGIEHPLTEQQIQAASDACDTAIYVVSRTTGESCERSPVPGDYYLSKIEYLNLQKLGNRFENVIVLLNTGASIDTNFFHGKSIYSRTEEDFVRVDFPDTCAFDADQFDREKTFYYTCDEPVNNTSGILLDKPMTRLSTDSVFDPELANPLSETKSILSTSGYYYWDPQYGSESTTTSKTRYRNVIFNHIQDHLFFYNPENASYEKIPGDSRYDIAKEYYMYNIFRQIDNLGSLVYISQGGQETGNAVVDILEGVVSPSGKLTDTWAIDYYDFPSSASFAHNDGTATDENYVEDIFVGYRYFDSFGVEPAYAFGFGRSYTQFSIDTAKIQIIPNGQEERSSSPGSVMTEVVVTNLGETAGCEVVELYVSAPSDVLSQPAQELAGYGKTKLLQPGETQTLTISFDIAALASYDMNQSAYVLEKGDYILRVGNCSRTIPQAGGALDAAGILHVDRTVIIQKLQAMERGVRTVTGQISPRQEVSIYAAEVLSDLPIYTIPIAQDWHPRSVTYSKDETTVYVSDSTYDEYAEYLKREGIEDLAENASGSVSFTSYTGETVNYSTNVTIFSGDYRDYTLYDVYEGTITIQEFVSSLTLKELASLVEGHKNQSESAAAYSVLGAAGETNGDLYTRAIPPMIMADGPAGLRLTQTYTDKKTQATINQFCTAWPVGTLLAQTWDQDLICRMGDAVGNEMIEMGVTLWLAPGMNIHRNPLGGRCFEYYSEDPLLTGNTALQLTMGVQYGYDKEPSEDNDRGIGVTLKHFYGNQQETFRQFTNSVMTERAAREIYLTAFQIVVEQAAPTAVMTSYNRCNGVPTADDRNLCTSILRDEWGFDGFVMTDWGGGSSTPGISMHAGNDLIMPGKMPKRIIDAVCHGDLATGKQNQREGDAIQISIGDVQKSAIHILQAVMRTNQFR